MGLNLTRENNAGKEPEWVGRWVVSGAGGVWVGGRGAAASSSDRGTLPTKGDGNNRNTIIIY